MFLVEKEYKMSLITRGLGRDAEYILIAMTSKEWSRKSMRCYELKPKIQIPKELKPEIINKETK